MRKDLKEIETSCGGAKGSQTISKDWDGREVRAAMLISGGLVLQ